MLYHFLYLLHDKISFLNVFRYITVRAAFATITAFALSIIFGPLAIHALKRLNVAEKINKGDSASLDDKHKGKQGTPTMGGVLILFAVLTSTLLWADTSSRYVLLAVGATAWLGVTGFVDDYLKLTRKKAKGLTAGTKLTSQVALGLIIGMILFADPRYSTQMDVPFFKELSLDLGVYYIFFSALVITASSNAVNLTDGLDGLAAGNVIMVAFAFSVLSYVSGNVRFSEYLLIPYVRHAGELTVFCASILGAALGFLWFNCYPASVFMGDVGSLALGGALGAVAILIKKELLLLVVGGVFALEAVSVILQVASFRVCKKRIFRCAPLHHHFEFLGWQENKVIVRFWILAGLFALLTLVTLKIR